MNTVTALVYWVIVGLWLAVLVTVCSAYYRNPKTFGTVRLLLAVVAIDTTRNIIENMYFGVYFGGRYGLFPASTYQILGSPGLLILPKLANVLAACLVLSLLLLRWLPLALQERRRADVDVRVTSAALTQEIEESRRIFQTSQDLILIVNPEELIVQASTSSEHLLKYVPAELIGRKVGEIFYPGDADALHRGMAAAREGGAMRNVAGRLVRKDNGMVDLLWMGTWSAQIGRLYLVGRDVTDSKLTQIALKESERMARGIIETALDAFVQFDENEIVVDWSQQAERLFGLSRAEAVGTRICALIGSHWDRVEDEEKFNRFMLDRAYSRAGERFELSAKHSDGADLRIEISLASFDRRQGLVFNGFARDITDRLLAESQIRQAQKMDAVGQLTGGVAHDFNNILTVITGTIEILADAVADRPELASIAKLIDEAAERGADLTRHLLAFARKQPLQPKRVDVNVLLEAAGKFIRPTLGEQVEIEIVSRRSTWPAFVDPHQLTTTVLNLAINARDAMPRGGKLVIEALNCYLDEDYADQHDEVSAGDYVMVAVSDTGAGIAPQLIDKVFEPFFTTKEGGKGTGLGLSMVYGFVKQSGGHIKIYSELGHGTTVKIYLPRGSDVAEDPSDIRPVEKIASGNELILIVEDDAMVRKYAIAQIQSLGYRTMDAVNGDSAIELIRDHPEIDLLFTDIIMPGALNGRELARAALKLRPNLGVVYTSGYTEDAIVHHGRLDEGVLLLAKPYRKSQLAEMLRTALRGGTETTLQPDMPAAVDSAAE
jgi:PAS domain S-box-containing protein